MVEQGCGAAGGRRTLPPNSRAVTGLRLGGTKTPRQELADSGPRLRCVVAKSAARHRQNAAMARRKAPVLATTRAYCPLTRLLGAPSPRIRGGDKEDRPPRAVTKNRGEDACLARVR